MLNLPSIRILKIKVKIPYGFFDWENNLLLRESLLDGFERHLNSLLFDCLSEDRIGENPGSIFIRFLSLLI